MDATEIINDRSVQHDPSGVGHAWRLATDIPASIAEEIACWIIENDPESGAVMIASNGQHYRVPPA